MIGRNKHRQEEGPQLRVLAATLEGFRFVARNPGIVLRLALPAALCLTAVHFALFGFAPPPEDETPGLMALLADSGDLIAEILFIAIVLVAWQRRILLGPGAVRMRLSKRELRMSLAVLLLVLVLALVYVAAILAAIPAVMAGAMGLAEGLEAAAWIATAYLAGRLYFALPPIAIDRETSLREAWRASGPQAHKLMLIVAIVSVPFEALSAFATGLSENALYAGAHAVLVGATLLDNVLFMLHILVEASALTFCYAALGGVRHILEARGMAPEPEAAPA